MKYNTSAETGKRFNLIYLFSGSRNSTAFILVRIFSLLIYFELNFSIECFGPFFFESLISRIELSTGNETQLGNASDDFPIRDYDFSQMMLKFNSQFVVTHLFHSDSAFHLLPNGSVCKIIEKKTFLFC